MKFDFVAEQREDGVHIIDVKPNDELQMPLPCNLREINGREIKTCDEFKKAYENAVTGDHKFLMLITYDGINSYINLPITE